MNKHGIKVGQTLWFSSPWRRNKPVVVESVGRKFARIVDVGCRVDLDTLAVSEGGYTIGVCYLSESDWERDQAIKRAWGALRDAIFRQIHPTAVTEQHIRDAAAMLGLAEFVSESEAP